MSALDLVLTDDAGDVGVGVHISVLMLGLV